MNVNDQIEVKSNTLGGWFPGTVVAVQGYLVQVQCFKPDGTPVTKVLPQGHPDLRCATSVSEATPTQATLSMPSYMNMPLSPEWASEQAIRVGSRVEILYRGNWYAGTVVHPEDETGKLSVQCDTDQPGNYTKARKDGMRLLSQSPQAQHQGAAHSLPQAGIEQKQGLAEPVMMPTLSNVRQAPPAGAPNVGDVVEVFSSSLSTWFSGTVARVEGPMVTVHYTASEGRMCSKTLSHNHPNLRCVNTAPVALGTDNLGAMQFNTSTTLAPPETYDFDVFFSHDWGNDSTGRDNHERVVQIAKAVRSIGVKVWLDTDNMNGHISAAMCQGIDKSKVFAIFVTANYCRKVYNSDESDNCKREFKYAELRRKQMVAVPMEEEMTNTSRWLGPVGMAVGTIVYPANFSACVIDGRDIQKFVDRINQLKGARDQHCT